MPLLVKHSNFHKSGVKDFNEIPRGDSQYLEPEELKCGVGLIEQMSNETFEPPAFESKPFTKIGLSYRSERVGFVAL